MKHIWLKNCKLCVNNFSILIVGTIFIFNDIKDDNNKDIEDNGNDDAHNVGTARHSDAKLALSPALQGSKANMRRQWTLIRKLLSADTLLSLLSAHR